MAVDPEELIEAGIELVEQLLDDGNVVGAGQLAERVAEWIEENKNED